MRCNMRFDCDCGDYTTETSRIDNHYLGNPLPVMDADSEPGPPEPPGMLVDLPVEYLPRNTHPSSPSHDSDSETDETPENLLDDYYHVRPRGKCMCLVTARAH